MRTIEIGRGNKHVGRGARRNARKEQRRQEPRPRRQRRHQQGRVSGHWEAASCCQESGHGGGARGVVTAEMFRKSLNKLLDIFFT